MDSNRVIPVQIHGQRYPIRCALDQEYVARLAAYVDEKMRAAADTTPTGDSLRLAVLAALNIADELFQLRRAASEEITQFERRTQSLIGLLDENLSAE